MEENITRAVQNDVNIIVTEPYVLTKALLYTIIYQSEMLILKNLRHSNMFYLQGARRLLVKVNGFKNLKM